MSDGEKKHYHFFSYYGGSGQNSRLYCIYAGREGCCFLKPKDAACEHFRIVTGPVYKCKADTQRKQWFTWKKAHTAPLPWL